MVLLNSPKTKSYVTPPEASRCILLKDCFNPSEETGTAWVKELEEDVKHECENKYGKVISLFCTLIQLSRLATSTSKKTLKVKFISNSRVSAPARKLCKD